MQIIFFEIIKVLLKNTFKVALQYPFDAIILFNTDFYLKPEFKLKIDPKMFTFENLKQNCKKQLAILSTMKFKVSHIKVVNARDHTSRAP